MLKKISDKMPVPDWWKKDPRFWRLEVFDRLVDGTFYDHLPHAFYDETEGEGGGGAPRLISIEDRRPSRQMNLATWVARKTSRKLWAGRHVPRIHHPDADTKASVRALVRRAKLFRTMMEVTYRGSVGSVALTFDIVGEQATPFVEAKIWKSKYCVPYFDANGDLTLLRVQYTTTAAALKALGEGGGTLEDGQVYWYITEYQKTQKVVIQPIKRDHWNPVEGWKDDDAKAKGFRRWEEQCKPNPFGFVLGQWFTNLSGGEIPDGGATWGSAVHDWIDLDYTRSQVGRGVRYNAAPQLVTIGPVQGGGQVTRGPVTHLQMPQSFKNEEGDTIGQGDAKLLEMTGHGMEAAMKDTDGLRKEALEQIAASRKDPENMKGPLSGRAMEYLDEDWEDLIMELRSAYGEDGFLPLLKKIVTAVAKFSGTNVDLKPELLSLRWPRLFQPTPTDIGQVIPALVQAINPLAVSPQGKSGGETGGGVEGMNPPEEFMLLKPAEARAWLADNMDLKLLEEEEDDAETADPEEPAPVEPATPPALEDGGGPDQPQNTPADPEPTHPLAGPTGDAVRRVTL